MRRSRLKASSLETKEEPTARSESQSREKLMSRQALEESFLIREGSAFLFYSSL